MKKIEIRKAKTDEFENGGIKNWPIWTCDPSRFDWFYDDQETCYIIEGEVTVISDSEKVCFGPGDIVTFPKGLACIWDVKKSVRKHYKFG